MKALSPKQLRSVATTVDGLLPAGTGFALITFEFHKGSYAQYISNAPRVTMIKALRECADRLQQQMN